MGILQSSDYTHTTANLRKIANLRTETVPTYAKPRICDWQMRGFSQVYRSDDPIRAIVYADFTQATIIGSTGTPGFIVEVMVALVT